MLTRHLCCPSAWAAGVSKDRVRVKGGELMTWSIQLNVRAGDDDEDEEDDDGGGEGNPHGKGSPSGR